MMGNMSVVWYLAKHRGIFIILPYVPSVPRSNRWFLPFRFAFVHRCISINKHSIA